VICANHQHSYEKRRTVLLSQYLGPEFAAQLQHDLRESPTASEPSGSRTASFAQQPSGHAPGFDPRASIASSNFEYAPSPANSSLGGSTQYMAYPPSQVGRFQEKQLGLRTSSLQRAPSQGSETFLPRPQTARIQLFARGHHDGLQLRLQPRHTAAGL
jgi:hypothetical protein